MDAIIDIAGESFCVCDEFSFDDLSMPRPGDEFEFEFANQLSDDEDWDMLFSSNPEHRIGIEKIEGWKYRAFGKVISINPVKVDCGLFVEEDVFHTNDPRVIGEFVGFTITCLGGYGS